MSDDIRLTKQTRRVLSAILERPFDRFSGAEISKATGLASGSLYPILMRLERAGWLHSEWEAGDPKALGRPRRRYYKLSADGARHCRQIASEFSPAGEGLVWA
ncbi:PadR family transcriptional regulator [Martelella lutilitoris]|uniref:PadR family transcriptional regulator n=1 Tax=Martelella lutilitoris TaxID=2583532 RepID=A0A5C4JSE8_9HYPH|nr:PadR family transcriptional regulator [Martelella lutilitoris]